MVAVSTHEDESHEVRLRAYVMRVVAAAPPLTSEQRDRIALALDLGTNVNGWGRRNRRISPGPSGQESAQNRV